MTVQQLLADPVRFIRKNLLTLSGALNEPRTQDLGPNRTVRLTLEQLPGGLEGYGALTRRRNRKGLAKLRNKIMGAEQHRAMDFYRVVLAGPNTPANDSFEAYICPYRQDHDLGAIVGTHASLMFTAEMTGCSFGVGMPARDGSRYVVHSNQARHATQDSTAPQEAAQLDALKERVQRGHALQPRHYRNVGDDGVDERATMIGVRTDGAWQFWYQHYNFGDGVTMLNVRRIC